MNIWFYPPPLRRRSCAGNPAAPAAIIRAAYRKLVWRRAYAWQRIVLFAAVATWPIWSLANAIRLTARLGGRVRGECGKSAFRQLTEQLDLAWHELIPPANYYMFEHYLEPHRAHAAGYLLRAETKGGAFFLLRPQKYQAGRRRPFRDKAAFAEECVAAGIRTAETLARFDRGVRVGASDAPPLPPADLFVKPLAGRGGRGAERWQYGDGRWSRRGRSFDQAGLLAHLAERSRKVGLLLQPRLVNHPDFAEINLGALSTFRVVTALDEQERPELIGAVLRMPSRAESPVDNFHAGGIAAPVDPATGRLGSATDMGLKPTTRWHAVHPVTGGRIDGRVVPHWPDVVALAIEAHARLGERVVIGWDIAVLADGPVIVEANGQPDQDIIQRIHRLPLGEGRLGQLLAHHLSRDAQWRKP